MATLLSNQQGARIYRQSKPKSFSPKLSPLKIKKAKSQDLLCGSADFNVRTDSLRNLFDWEKRHKLGSGAFAHVYRATCVQSIEAESDVLWGTGSLQAGKEYAVKTLPREFLQKDCKHHKNLIHEVAILHHIKHPNCIKLHDVFEDLDDDSVVLCLEYVPGGELLQMLQDHVKQGGCLTEGQARNIVSQLLDALVYLQDEQIVHRDIKPENIMINPETLQIKIIDFGFAKFFGQQAPHGMEDMVAASPLLMTPLGTLKYMPPEVLNVLSPNKDRLFRAREQVHKLDMFAVGVVTYMILGGSHPFSCRSYNDLPELIEDGASFMGPHFANISNRAKDFCMKLMNYQAEMRPTAKEAMLHPWFQFPIGAQGAQPIVIQETRSPGMLMDWLREQSRAEHNLDEMMMTPKRIAAKQSPVSWSKAWNRPPAQDIISLKHSENIPILANVQKDMAISPNENWADMSCGFDSFCNGTPDPINIPTPLTLGPAAPQYSGSPPSQTALHPEPSTEKWADMSFDEDSFWANTSGMY